MNNPTSKAKIKIGSEKNFGYVFSVVFSIVAFFIWREHHALSLITLCLSAIILGLTTFKPGVFYWPNKIWFKFGLLLGLITTPIVLTLVFAITIIPIALIYKIIRKDPLQRKIDPKTKSYWIIRDNDRQSMKRQF